jgi:hypothetical protein
MTPSAKMNVILIALVISLGLNIYGICLLRCGFGCENTCEKGKSKSGTREILQSFCDNGGRYDNENENKGGQELSYEEALAQVNDYYSKHKDRNDEYKTTGFILSKKAFDKIFSDDKELVNSVRLDLILIKDELHIVAKGIVRKNTGLNYVDPAKEPSRIYINQSMCPADCNYVIDKY